MSDDLKISVTRESFRHAGGTKDYHLILLKNVETHDAIFMTRFGRADTHGKSEIQFLNSGSEARRVYEKKRKEKLGRGYTHEIKDIGTVRAKLPIAGWSIKEESQFADYFTREELRDLTANGALESLIDGKTFHEKMSRGIAFEMPAVNGQIIKEETVEQKPKVDPYEKDSLWGSF
jgi:hypothetical protein